MKIRISILAAILLTVICWTAYAACGSDPEPPGPEYTTLPLDNLCPLGVIHADRPCAGAPEPVEFVADERIPLSEDLQRYIRDVCDGYEMDETIVYGMIRQESDFTADLVCDKGRSVGLMQIQSRWHKDRMDRLLVSDLTDPFDNVLVGIDYISELRNAYNGDMIKALTAYNRGINGANKYFTKGYTSSDYADKVLGYAEEYRNGREEL